LMKIKENEIFNQFVYKKIFIEYVEKHISMRNDEKENICM